MKTEKNCPSCNGNEFEEATDFMPVNLKNPRSPVQIKFTRFV
ncbi:hypothetical protein JNUCC1_01682 [Lentibacillus sp. JNUCC-1]|nr:hypothetical protein [Lentibacillus sp. JNUCC-1]